MFLCSCRWNEATYIKWNVYNRKICEISCRLGSCHQSFTIFSYAIMNCSWNGATYIKWKVTNSLLSLAVTCPYCQFLAVSQITKQKTNIVCSVASIFKSYIHMSSKVIKLLISERNIETSNERFGVAVCLFFFKKVHCLNSPSHKYLHVIDWLEECT